MILRTNYCKPTLHLIHTCFHIQVFPELCAAVSVPKVPLQHLWPWRSIASLWCIWIKGCWLQTEVRLWTPCNDYATSIIWGSPPFRRMLELGQSVPWPDALEILTGQRDFDASAIIEYFQPLMQWLEIQNQGENLDWDEKCPEGSFTSSSVPLTWSTLLIVLVLIRYWL